MAETSTTKKKPAAKRPAAKKPAAKKRASSGSSTGESSAVKDKIRESLMSKATGGESAGPSQSSDAGARASSGSAPAFEQAWEPPAQPKARFGTRKSTEKEISGFLRQLATLQDAGLPLMKSLKILERRAKGSDLRSTVSSVVADLERGSQLWAAFAKHPGHFSRMVVNVVRTGEESGSLVTVLDYLAGYRDHEQDVNRNVQQAVTYPLIMLVFAIGVAIVLIVAVIPQFAESYAALGVELPWFTRALFGASDAMKYFFLALFALVALGSWINRKSMSDGGIRHFVDRIRIKVPLFGPIMTKVYVVQFTTLLSILLKSGLPLLKALDLVRETVDNAIFEDAFAYIRDNVERGRTLEESFQPFDFFPPLVLDMIAVGEEAGSLPTVLDQIALTFQKEVDHDSAVAGKLLEPMMLLGLGLFVLFIALSLIVPYFGMMEHVS